MISLNFDRNLLAFVSTPGNPSPTSLKWVYGDNYNVQVGVVSGGVPDSLNVSDSLAVLVYVPGTLPATNVATIGTPVKTTDANGNDCYQVNVNLFTTALATLVQTPNTTLPFNLRVIFSPVDGERFSSATDVSVTIEPDPSQGSSGATPASGTYPALNGNAATFLDGVGAWATPVGLPYRTTTATFTIPASGSTVAVTVGANTDLVVNQILTISDGTHFINAQITAISGTTVTVRNLGSGSVSGTMAAGHLYIGGALPSTGGNPYVTTVATFAIPAAQSTVVGTVASAADLLVGETVLITDGTLFINAVVTVVSGTSVTFKNIGAPGAITGTMGAAHVYLGSSQDVATTSQAGIVKPDGTTVSVSAGVISVPTATTGALGIVKPDGTTVNISSGVISVPTSTTSLLGLVKPDGTTITISSGVISSSGGSASFLTTVATFTIPAAQTTVGVTVGSGTDLVVGMTLYITDGTHFINAVLNGIAGTSATIKNIGAPGSVSGTMGAAHLYVGNVPDRGTTGQVGSLSPDGTTITVSSGTISVPTATTSLLGIVKPDGLSVGVASGLISTIQNAARSHVGSTLAANTTVSNAFALTFDTSDFDTSSYHTGSTWNALVASAGNAGYHHITGSVAFPASMGTSTTYGLTITVNSVTVAQTIIAGDPTSLITQISHIGKLNNGDIVKLLVNWNSGSTTTFTSNVSTYLAVLRG